MGAETTGRAADRDPVDGAQVAAVTTTVTAAVPATAAAYDQLYATVATRLTWQTYLLTASRHRAAHCVRRSFQLAWTNWWAVSADASPEGWLRATAFDLALSPWHRGGPRMQHLVRLPHRRPRGAAAGAPELPLTNHDRALLKALQRLPRPQRRALVLHDVIGLDWAQTAAEVEGSTPVTFGRVARARRALARSVPGVAGADPDAPGFGRRLGAQLHATAVRACAGMPLPPPARVTRARARLHDVGLTLAAAALTLAVAGFLGAALLWGTPMHPAEQPVVRHPSHPVTGVADVAPAATQPERLPTSRFTPYTTGSGVIPKNPASDAKSSRHSGRHGAGADADSGFGAFEGSGGSGRGGTGSDRGPSGAAAGSRAQHGHPHQPPARKHH